MLNKKESMEMKLVLFLFKFFGLKITWQKILVFYPISCESTYTLKNSDSCVGNIWSTIKWEEVYRILELVSRNSYFVDLIVKISTALCQISFTWMVLWNVCP